MELQLVSFEQAKALKELGFPQDIFLRYITHKYTEPSNPWEIHSEGTLINKGYCSDSKKDIFMYCSAAAPTLELVAKWLREEKGLHIYYNVCKNKNQHVWNLYSVFDFMNDIEHDCFSSFKESEEALSAGIDKAIEILKKK